MYSTLEKAPYTLEELVYFAVVNKDNILIILEWYVQGLQISLS